MAGDVQRNGTLTPLILVRIQVPQPANPSFPVSPPFVRQTSRQGDETRRRQLDRALTGEDGPDNLGREIEQAQQHGEILPPYPQPCTHRFRIRRACWRAAPHPRPRRVEDNRRHSARSPRAACASHAGSFPCALAIQSASWSLTAAGRTGFSTRPALVLLSLMSIERDWRVCAGFRCAPKCLRSDRSLHSRVGSPRR
jgi:hypothetical protein